MVCDYMLKTHSVTVEHKESYRCISTSVSSESVYLDAGLRSFLRQCLFLSSDSNPKNSLILAAEVVEDKYNRSYFKNKSSV